MSSTVPSMLAELLAQRAITSFRALYIAIERLPGVRRVLLRNDPSRGSVQPVQIVQPVQQCGGTNAPMRCSPRATASRKRHKKRDILRRTAMHASHRRELLVPRERRRPVESQRASSHTPREFMAVQKRRFFVLRMPSHRRPQDDQAQDEKRS